MLDYYVVSVCPLTYDLYILEKLVELTKSKTTMCYPWAEWLVSLLTSGVAKPRHTWARAQATFACARAFASRSLVFHTLIFRTLRSTIYVPYLCPTNYSIQGMPLLLTE